MQLSQIILVDKEKCVNSFQCSTFCPVENCITKSGDQVITNINLCNGCGKCIPACEQGARKLVNKQDFMDEISKKNEYSHKIITDQWEQISKLIK